MLPCVLALGKGESSFHGEVLWSLVWESRGGLLPGDRERREWLPEPIPKAVIEKLAKDRRLRRSGLELAVHAPVPCVIDTMPILKESCMFLPPCGGSWEHERASLIH